MEICSFDSYKPVETALKEAGFKVDEVVKHGKKIVVTITRHTKPGKGREQLKTHFVNNGGIK